MNKEQVNTNNDDDDDDNYKQEHWGDVSCDCICVGCVSCVVERRLVWGTEVCRCDHTKSWGEGLRAPFVLLDGRQALRAWPRVLLDVFLRLSGLFNHI
jgi:hypothetical protein